MRKFLFCLALLVALPALSYGQIDPVKFKKDAPALEQSINEIVGGVLPAYGLTQPARATYVEGYGLVFVLEVTLERSANPFFSPPAAEVKSTIERRHKEIKEKVAQLLKQRFDKLKGPGDSIAVVVYLTNYNQGIVPDLPGQIVFTAKRQDAEVNVITREF